MHHQVISTTQQICFRMLCAMQREAENAPISRKRLLNLTARARRRVSRRNGECAHCVYSQRCLHPAESKLIKPSKDTAAQADGPSGVSG